MSPTLSAISSIFARALRYIFMMVLLVAIHWISVRFYATYCAPSTIAGFVWSFMTSASPICTGALYVMEKTSGMYSMMTMVVATACIESVISVYHMIGFRQDQKLIAPAAA
jgi:hypothetical protein